MGKVAERLKLAIEKQMGGNVNEFHRTMKERLKETEVRGYTYPSITKYLSGDVSPRMEFLEHAADALEVRLPWLAADDGPMTEEEVRVSGHAGAADETRDRQRYDAWRLKLKVLHAMGVLPRSIELQAMPGRIESLDDFLGFAQRANVSYLPPWVPALAEVRARYGRDRVDPDVLGRVLRGPLEALGIDPSSGADRTYRTQEWLDDYIAGMVPVLLALAPEITKQLESATTEEEADG